MKIENLELFSYQLDLNTPIFLKGYELHQRQGFVLKLTTENKQVAFSDIAPLDHFHPEMLRDIQNIFPRLKKALINTHWSLRLLLKSDHLLFNELSLGNYPSLYFGIEFAILSLLMPKLHLFEKIKINALLPREELPAIKKLGLIKSFRSIKLKAYDKSPEELLEFIEKIKPHLKPHQKLRIDFNRSYTLDQLLTFCDKFPIELCDYLEEPLKNPFELLAFSNYFSHPIAYDESLLDTSLDFLLSIPTKSALVIKPTLLGSLQKMAYLYSKACMHNLKFILTSTFESGLGHLQIAHLAHYFAIEDPIGLDTYSYLKEDILLKPLEFDQDTLNIKDQHILNPYLNTSLLTPCL